MPIPLGYRRIADDLRSRIARGEWSPGDQMPTYNQLAEQYRSGVSTVQKAVNILRAEGLVVGVQGAGLYVAEREGKTDG